MDSRIMLKMVKEIKAIEKREKTIEDAIADMNVQTDIERERAARKERQRLWILGLPGGSIE
jgi:hypothetical protein